MLNNSKIELYVHIPNHLKTKIDSIFFDFSQKQLNKIYFLVWKINSKESIQINIRNFSAMLAFNTGGLTAVLNKLRTNLIINTDADYCPKLKSNSYYLLKRYDTSYNKPTDFQLFYNSANCDVPVWVQKYCTDAGVVKAAKYSSYIKGKSAAEIKIENLENEVRELRELLKMANVYSEEVDVKANLCEYSIRTKKYYILNYSQFRSKFKDASLRMMVMNILCEKPNSFSQKLMLENGGLLLFDKFIQEGEVFIQIEN